MKHRSKPSDWLTSLSASVTMATKLSGNTPDFPLISPRHQPGSPVSWKRRRRRRRRRRGRRGKKSARTWGNYSSKCYTIIGMAENTNSTQDAAVVMCSNATI